MEAVGTGLINKYSLCLHTEGHQCAGKEAGFVAFFLPWQLLPVLVTNV